MTEHDCEGHCLNLRELLKEPRDSDIFIISPADELAFARAVMQLVHVTFMCRMEPNGFDFAWEGKRIKFRTDINQPQGSIVCENITVKNFVGVHGSPPVPYDQLY